jgi:uncharacterized membrane protein YGL010W
VKEQLLNIVLMPLILSFFMTLPTLLISAFCVFTWMAICQLEKSEVIPAALAAASYSVTIVACTIFSWISMFSWNTSWNTR